MFLLFFLLAILMVIEATTSISRLSGYKLNFPEGGLILQSSLSLLSRAIMFLFMPYLGYLSDSNNILNNQYEILQAFTIIPLLLIILFFVKTKVLAFYNTLIMNVKTSGSFFRKNYKETIVDNNKITKNRKIKRLKGFYNLILFAYVPYYLAWPAVIVLLDVYNEQRGMILGMSAIFNGLNTILLTVFIDPKLISLGRHKKLLETLYFDQLRLRLYASMISLVIIFLSIIVLK